MTKTRAQISMEYLILVGVAMMMVLPSVYLFSERQKAYESEIISGQVNQAGDLIMGDVKTIYALGKGSKSVIDVNLPKGIKNMTILAGRELVFKTTSSKGESDIVFFCYFCSNAGPTINGTFSVEDYSAGRKSFRIKACSNYVLIERVIRNTTGEIQSAGPAYNCN